VKRRTPDELERDFQAVNRELEDLAAGKVTPGNVGPAEREAELLEALDAIEYEAGLDWLERRKRDGET
jgi:hypothetical protein